MSYTFTEHRTDGVTTTFPFRFAGKDKGYLRSSDVSVYMKVEGEWTEARNWTLSGTNQITFATAPAAAADINLRIRRIVPKTDPYAEFARGPALDMRSMNYAFIQNLQVTQELMDGFMPEGFFYKGDINYGGNKITGVGNGTEPSDAVNFGQLSAIDAKHTEWNNKQDLAIEGLKASLGSGTSHRTIPWATVSTQGQKTVSPPYTFTSAMVFLNGILQHEIQGAVSISNNVVTFAEPLEAGIDILVLVGSRIAAPEDGVSEVNLEVADGTTTIDLGVEFNLVTVYLDGLKQPTSAYLIENTTVVFKEPLPACAFSALVVVAKGG